MLIMASLISVTSCSKDDDDRPDIPKKISMTVGDVYSFEYQGDWASTKPFVATVDENGAVTAVRAGEAKIYSAELGLKCDVTVVPEYTLYDEPITEWGISKSDLIKKRGTPDAFLETSIAYQTNNDATTLEMYIFEDNTLSMAAVDVNTLYTEELLEHLSQRMLPAYYDEEEYIIYFIDAETLEDAETVVLAQLYEEDGYWLVAYMPNISTRGVSNFEDLYKNVKSQFDSFSAKMKF